MTHPTHSRSGALAHFLDVSLYEDVVDSLRQGEPLCCLARPGGGAKALLDDLQRTFAARRKVVRFSLEECRDCLDAVGALALAVAQAGLPAAPGDVAGEVATCCADTVRGDLGARSSLTLVRARLVAGSWRESLADMLKHLAEHGPALLLLEGLSPFLLAWQGGVAAPQDSSRRMELRVFFDLLAQASSDRLAVVLSATPGLTTLLKCLRAEDVLAPFNELPVNLPGSEAVSHSTLAVDCVRERAAAMGLAMTAEVAARAVECVGLASPEYLALVLEHAVKAAALADVSFVSMEMLEEIVSQRLLGPFEHRRWRAQEESLYACVDPTHLPLVLELLRRAGQTAQTGQTDQTVLADQADQADQSGVTMEEAFRLAGVGSAFGPMPVHLLRLHLEWLEQEGFLERQGDRYRIPDSLFGRWLAAVHAGCAAQAPGGGSPAV